MTATGAKLSLTGIDGSFPASPLPTRQEREKFISDWEAVPDEKYKQYLLAWNRSEELSNEAACAITDWNEAMHYIDDSAGLCAYQSSFRSGIGGGAIYHIHTIPHLISLVTGLEFDETFIKKHPSNCQVYQLGVQLIPKKGKMLWWRLGDNLTFSQTL